MQYNEITMRLPGITTKLARDNKRFWSKLKPEKRKRMLSEILKLANLKPTGVCLDGRY